MGMTVVLRRVKPGQLHDVESGKVDVAWLMENEADGCGIDKSWHGIHYLLTGQAWGGSGELAFLMAGGEEVGEDLGYGPPQFHRPDAVRRIASALEAIDRAELSRRYDPAAMSAAGVYPSVWEEEGEEALEYLLDSYDPMRDFLLHAGQAGDGLLVMMV